MVTELLFELIQVSLGNKEKFCFSPSEDEWVELFEQAIKHSIAGVLFVGLEKTINTTHCKIPEIFFEWFGTQQQIATSNELQNLRSKEIYNIFRKAGFRSCVLKGQGTAMYYQQPEYRQCGDIDLWVEGDRDDVVKFIEIKGYQIDCIDIKNAEVKFFEDVPVEIHFRPNCMYEPIVDKRLQNFFRRNADTQFSAFDEQLGFAHTTNAFDLVYCIVHIYRHFFSEGIGLRQVVDYYYILSKSVANDRQSAFHDLCRFRMTSFVGGVMFILVEKLGMSAERLLCEPNKKHGEFLLKEILISGNFGLYDHRTRKIDKQKRFVRGFVMLRRNLRFVRYYPTEVLCSPFWKLYHYFWRKCKGYL